jgi:hypothetical protein
VTFAVEAFESRVLIYVLVLLAGVLILQKVVAEVLVGVMAESVAEADSKKSPSLIRLS